MATERETTAEEVLELLAFLPGFEEPGRSFADWDKGSFDRERKIATLPYPNYAEDVNHFYRVIHTPQWLFGGYLDLKPGELAQDPERIADASLEEIKALLTWCVRGERFCDGHMDEVFKLGIPQAALRRLKQLHDCSGLGFAKGNESS